MAKFLSGRQSQFNVGVTSSTENKTVLQVTGKVGIGTTEANGRNLYVVGNTEITGVTTLKTLNVIDSQIISGVTTFTNTTDNTLGYPNTGAVQIDGGLGVDKNVSIGGTTNLGGNLYFNNTNKAIFGGGDSLQVYHDGTNSYIVDSGAGDLYIRGTAKINLQNASGSENYARFNVDGSSELYYDNVKKLETTFDGITVYGSVNATGISTFTDDVNFSTNVGIATTAAKTPLQVESYGIKTGFGTFAATVGVTTNIDSFTIPSTDFKMVEYTVHLQSVLGFQAQKVLLMQNGSVSYSQEYAIMFEPNLLVAIGSTISGNTCKLQVTPETGITGIITYRFSRGSIL